MSRSDQNLENVIESLQSKKLLQSIDKYAKRINEDNQHHKHRGNYQRDRDRILYTTSLRHLSGKTQIFNVGMGEHYRNRLTHTLQVIQIATTISRCLGLNTDLTEAIALGHDIGHAPFGHVGERTLNNIMNNCDILDKYDIELGEAQKGFKHNLQGLRILCDIEKISRDYNGINITKETLWGIAHHSKLYLGKCEKLDNDNHPFCLLRRDRQDFKCPNYDNSKANQNVDFYKKYLEQIPDDDSWSFEAFIVSCADEIAQRHHDIEDGIISNIFEPMDFIDIFKECFGKADYYSDIKTSVDKLQNEIEKNIISLEYLLPMLAGFIVDLYVHNCISFAAQTLDDYIRRYSIETSMDFYREKEKIFKENKFDEKMPFDNAFGEPDINLKKSLYNRIISSQKAKLMDGKGNYIIRKLFEAYLSTPNQLPDNVVKSLFTDFGLLHREDGSHEDREKSAKFEIGWLRDELEGKTTQKDEKLLSDLCRNICDYIASMTDRYALKQYEELYGYTNLS
jgi:dGTPase